ncbi:hypothetical protein [Aliiroseovarius crassostreae]|uniref:hypothetical protein n=1 Tax=Aliiroseovarius crassostreae TaxID=154981 RepID=UPI0021FF8775|nr:hypothetical protein [Aliiroseovarius crassostreae]UWQ03984.1 hypothetical protein K3X22_09780 [Aliiroseovarius crassostreae]
MTGAAWAQDVVAKEPYEFFQKPTIEADRACQNLMFSTLSDNVEGFSRIEISTPQYWDSNVQGGRMFVYANTAFRSETGDATGQVFCLTLPQKNLIVEIAYIFDGKGLAGFGTLPGLPKNNTYRTMHVMMTPTQYEGTE